MSNTIHTNGPGKYDDACTIARESTKAVACLLVVIEGEHGNGFSVQTLEPDLLPVIPALLRTMAAEIEKENQRNAN
jgi:hypothetical protein